MKQAEIYVNDVLCGILPEKMKIGYCSLLDKRVRAL